MKNIIRKNMLEIRKSLNKAEVQILNDSLVLQIKSDKNYLEAKTVALYMPKEDEISLLPLLSEDKIFLFPKTYKKTLEFYPYDKEKTTWLPSKFGVLEPYGISAYTKTIDYMIVPALAIDKENNRLGYGKGFYDRYLQEKRPKTVVGIIYPFQEIEKLEVDEYDQKLDYYFKGKL